MRKELVSKAYAEGVAYVGHFSADSCGECGEWAQVSDTLGVCPLCAWASVEYSERHGTLSDSLAEQFGDGVYRPRIDGALVHGFMGGVSDVLDRVLLLARVNVA